MEIFPYVGVGDFHFEENFNSIKSKLSEFKMVHERDKVEMDRTFPSLYVQDIDLYIVFLENGERVRFFETGNEVHHLGKDLHNEPLKELRQVYRKLDKNLTKVDDGIDSPMFGIRITKNDDNAGNTVLVYSKEYAAEPAVSEDDIINYFLK